jgi:Tfp pilus assembly protein PilV
MSAPTPTTAGRTQGPLLLARHAPVRLARHACTEEGIALIVVLLAGMLLSALGLALLLTSNTETNIAANARSARQAVYAADAAVERARLDLASTSNWTRVLASGAVPECAQTMSTFAATSCGDATQLVATLPGTTETVDLRAVTDAIQQTTDAQNLWGPNDPVWRLYAFGPVASLLPGGSADSPLYLALWVADDPSETDGVPSVDANGILTLHAEAYGPTGTRRIIDATIARPPAGHPGTRLVSWRLEP